MKIEKLIPSCNLETVKDGRGGIFTYIPKDPIVEFNFNIVKAGKVRGNHYHPEFDEYYLLTSGEGVLVSKDTPDSKEEFIYMGRVNVLEHQKTQVMFFLQLQIVL